MTVAPVLRKRAHLIDIPEEVYSVDDLRVLDRQIAEQIAYRVSLRDNRPGAVIWMPPRHVVVRA